MNELHVVFGTGPVGTWIARALRDKSIAVRAVNRTGKRPALMPENVEVVAADIYDAQQAMDAAKGATVVYQALNAPYHQWKKYFPTLQANTMAAARSTGARYVSIENLYMYNPSQTITQNAPLAPLSGKGKVRRSMAEKVMMAQQRGEIQAAALRSSDYYGPGVVLSAMGERVFGNLFAGKKAQVLGAADQPHSWAYIEDVGRAAALIGTSEKAFGKVWMTPHAPPCTQKEMVKKIGRVLGINPQMMIISPLMLRLAGLFSPGARASVEMMYQFTAPFVVDTKHFQESFGMEATPLDEGIERTVRWYVGRDD